MDKYHYSNAIPIRYFSSLYKHRKPWLTKGLLTSIKINNKLHRRRHQNMIKYTANRNRLNHLLHIAEKPYFNSMIEENKQNFYQI